MAHEPMLTISESAKALQVSQRTLYRMAHDGRLPVVWITRKILRVPRAAVERVLQGESLCEGRA